MCSWRNSHMRNELTRDLTHDVEAASRQTTRTVISVGSRDKDCAADVLFFCKSLCFRCGLRCAILGMHQGCINDAQRTVGACGRERCS